MVIVQHFPDSVKQYAEASPCPGRAFAIPDVCPHPDCQAGAALIRWGAYERWARLPDEAYRILVQRIRCQVCGRTHSLLPDFLHPYSTVREWIDSFTYGASEFWLDLLSHRLLALDPLTELPNTASPQHLNRILDLTKRRRLERAHRFWLLAEQLYAQVKARQPRLHFAVEQLFPFLLHWLQHQALPARLFWRPALSTTPPPPF